MANKKIKLGTFGLPFAIIDESTRKVTIAEGLLKFHVLDIDSIVGFATEVNWLKTILIINAGGIRHAIKGVLPGKANILQAEIEKLQKPKSICPYCAEEVKAAAVICKHCGKEISPKAIPARST